LLDQLAQRERLAVQNIQNALQGHQIAMRRLQQIEQSCTVLEQEVNASVNFATQMANTQAAVIGSQGGYGSQAGFGYGTQSSGGSSSR
jgi:hypothetical protein